MKDENENTSSQKLVLRRRLLRFTSACTKAFWFLIVLGAGILYGVAGTEIFSKLVAVPSNGNGSGNGLMLASFLAGVPFAIGMLIVWLAHRRRITGFVGSIGLTTLAIAVFVFSAAAFMGEGGLCIIVALPMFLIASVVGVLLGKFLIYLEVSRRSKLMSVALVVPILIAPIEARLSPEPARQHTVRSIFIQASPDVIWHHLNYPLDIKPAELSGGLAYRIGVPYPIEARTLEERIGGKRVLRWERGIQFEEVITDWELHRHIGWRYNFNSDSFPPGSLDDHVVIGGRYFDLTTTSYSLAPEADGTRLTIRVNTRVTTTFNWYAGFWARLLIADTADAILKFYKNRSEQHQRDGFGV